MVDRIPFGKSLLGESIDPSEFKVRGSTRKRRRPEVSPQIKDKIANFLPEEVSESPVRKFLRQFEYSEGEGMPKNNSKTSLSSPNKSDTNAAEMEKTKQEQEDFRREIKEAIEASSSEIKTANANSVDQIKRDQQEFMNKISEVIGTAQAGVDKKLSALSEKVEVQTNEFTALREDLRALQDKVTELEKRESEAKLIEERRGLEDEVLREFREEETKIVVIGFSFSESDNNITDKLMKDTLRDGVELLGPIKIVWKKAASDDKKSVIILDAGSVWNREHILRNQKPGKDFMVKKSIPKRFRDAENVLKERARTMRVINLNSIKTEVEIRGTKMVLLVKEKTPVGAKANEWSVEQEIDLLDEAAKAPAESYKMKEKGKSVLVTMNLGMSEPTLLKTLIANKLTRFEELKVIAVDKRNAVIDCPDADVALEVSALLKVEVTDSRVSMN